MELIIDSIGCGYHYSRHMRRVPNQYKAITIIEHEDLYYKAIIKGGESYIERIS